MTDEDKKKEAETPPRVIRGTDSEYCDKHHQWYLSGGECPKCRAEAAGK